MQHISVSVDDSGAVSIFTVLTFTFLGSLGLLFFGPFLGITVFFFDFVAGFFIFSFLEDTCVCFFSLVCFFPLDTDFFVTSFNMMVSLLLQINDMCK